MFSRINFNMTTEEFNRFLTQTSVESLKLLNEYLPARISLLLGDEDSLKSALVFLNAEFAKYPENVEGDKEIIADINKEINRIAPLLIEVHQERIQRQIQLRKLQAAIKIKIGSKRSQFANTDAAIALEAKLNREPADAADVIKLLYTSAHETYLKLCDDHEMNDAIKAKTATICLAILNDPHNNQHVVNLDALIQENQSAIKKSIAIGAILVFAAIAALVGAIAIAVFTPPLIALPLAATIVLEIINFSFLATLTTGLAFFGGDHFFRKAHHTHQINGDLQKMANNEMCCQARRL